MILRLNLLGIILQETIQRLYFMGNDFLLKCTGNDLTIKFHWK